MDKKKYMNPLAKQVFSLPFMVDEQVDYCFSEKVLQNILSMAEAFDIRKIYITGCGDSIAAAGVMAPVLKAYTEVFHCEMVEAMEFNRFMTVKDVGIGEPNSPLVIAVSAGGGTARMVETMQKANELGAFTIAMTNNSESPTAKNAKRVFDLHTPKMENDFPGLRSYFASMTGLAALACRIGHVRGVLGPRAEKEIGSALKSYVHSYEGVLDQIDNQMFELARVWNKFEHFDFIGDDTELYSALFGMEKFIECTGVHCNYDDSEDWCHIDYHIKNPQNIGTIIFADKNQASYRRIRETIAAACGIRRPVLVITNADDIFPEEAVVCRVPEAPEGYEWMLPMMDFVPAALLAGYCCTLGNRKFFNEYDPIAGEYNGEGKFFNASVMTMKSSKIKIYL